MEIDDLQSNGFTNSDDIKIYNTRLRARERTNLVGRSQLIYSESERTKS